MHLELVELLRCPVPHESTVLVAATNEVQSRYIVNGVLGCPVCGAEYAIANGVTYFANDNLRSHNDLSESSAATDDSESAAMALAAQLGLREGRGGYALVGYSAAVAVALRSLVPARLLLLNPPDIERAYATLSQSLAVAPAGIISSTAVPLIASKFDGAAIAPSAAMHAHQLVSPLRVRARLVAPVGEPVPATMREIVRDHSVWVAEREATASAPITLERRH